MVNIKMRRAFLTFVLVGPILTLSGCESVNGNSGGAVYYDALLWNDYYGRPDARPPDPGRPVHPIAPVPPRPVPPIVRPPISRPPVVRPPVARPPIARPPIARPSRR